MLVHQECRHVKSTPQVRALERAFKRSSEGQRLNKLIREKNVDGFLPRSVGTYMNARYQCRFAYEDIVLCYPLAEKERRWAHRYQERDWILPWGQEGYEGWISRLLTLLPQDPYQRRCAPSMHI